MSWWYDFSRNWYDEDEIQHMLTRLQRISAAGLEFERESVAEIALVVHRSCAAITRYRVARYEDYQDELGLDRNLTTRQIVQEMGRVGAPWDFYSFGDLGALPRHKHKLFYFMNTFMLTDKERATVETLKRDGNVLVFVYASGWMNQDRRPAADLANMAALTGFEFESVDETRSLVSRITSAGARCLPAIEEGLAFGEFQRPLSTGFEIDPNRPGRLPPVIEANPVFYPDQTDAVVLGEYAWNELPSFVMREHEDWTSVYIGATSVPATIVRSLAAHAGVHLYGEDDTITYVDSHFVGIHSSKAGRHVIELPEPRCVADAYEGTMVGDNLERIDVDMEEKQTKIFFTGSGVEVRRFLDFMK